MLRPSVVASLLSFLVFSSGAEVVNAQKKSRTQSVRVVEARLETFRDRAEALGTLKANESVALTVNVTENISAIHFEDGQSVKTNEILVEMVSAEENALLVEAETNVHEAKRQLNRIRQLVKAGTASEATYDQRLRDYDSAKARLTAVQSRLKDRVVKAPFDGVVGLRNVSLGALVKPGDVITTLTDDSQMKLDFAVPSVFLPVIEEDLLITAKARVYPDMAFEGVISSINNQIDPVTRSIIVRAKLPNDRSLLKQGMLMNVEVYMQERKSIALPEEALLPKGKDNFVMVATKKDSNFVAERRKVQIASRREGEVEIIDGLLEGELVVTHGAFKIKTGTELAIESSKKSEQGASTP